MNLTMTVMKEGDDCQFFVDKFPEGSRDKFALSAKPAIFTQRPIFTQDTGDFGPLLILPLDQAKKMAQEILKL